MSSTEPGPVEIGGPFIIELDEESWTEHLDRAQAWLGNVITAQNAFRRLLEDIVPTIEKPNIRLFLSEMLDRAAEHEEKARNLLRHIDREPSAGREAAGAVVAGVRSVVGTVEGLAGGGKGNWRKIRELLIANLDAMGAFAIAEQIGLALGIHPLRDETFQITAVKSSDQLILQEIMLEMASASILYGEDV